MYIDESTIERYVRAPDAMDAAMRKRLEAYLEKSAFARATADFYRSYYAEYDHLEEPASPALEAFVDHVISQAPPPAPPPEALLTKLGHAEQLASDGMRPHLIAERLELSVSTLLQLIQRHLVRDA